MSLFNRLGASILWVAVVAAGCGTDDSAGKPRACVPNASVGCTGPGNCSGYQVCAADGSEYSACDCGDAASGGSAGVSGSGGSSGSGGTPPDGGGVGGAAGIGGGTGGAGTGGGGGDAGTCSAFCQKRAAPKCKYEDPYAACYTKCVADLPTYESSCATETAAWYSCFSSTATTACNSMEYLKHAGCNGEWAAFLKCAGCLKAPSDTACLSCSKTKCCAQFQSAYAHPQMGPYLDCLYSCTDSGCEGVCASTYSGFIQAITLASGCQSSQCKC